ncbi:MAG TPA: hypothetical protein VHJ20_08435 [Polyangia bacterium]|nr:hypothetical protein [Polyangia bacterium]
MATFGRMILGWVGILTALFSAWLGGELVETLGVSVRDGANPDAPSSLGPSGSAGAARTFPVQRGV